MLRCAVAFMLFAAGSPSLGSSVGLARPAPQDNIDIAISVNDPRPLAAAIETLENRFGWTVTYEDAPYLFGGDLADVTAIVRRDGKSEPKVLIPLGGTLNFNYRLNTAGRPPSPADEESVLRALIEEYRITINAAVFDLRRTGDVYHVVPKQSRDVLGAMQPYSPLLDTRITLPDREYTGLQLFEAIVSAVNPDKRRFILGMVPLNLFAHAHVRISAQGEPARLVVLRALKAIDGRLSWQLFCGPDTPIDPCALNVHVVKAPGAGTGIPGTSSASGSSGTTGPRNALALASFFN
jgi:hypothetical protein